MSGPPGADPSGPGPRFDWAQLHRRLARTVELLAQPVVSAETRSRVLRQRAHAAARESAADEDAAARIQVVEFLMAYEHYAVETRWVHEVVALRDLTSLPGAPGFVAGLVNVRGRIVSVVDLKVFFDLPAKGLPDLNRVLIVGDEAIEFGLLVDAVVGVAQLRPDQLQPALPTMTGVREEYLRGLTPERIAVLDGARILTDPRIVVRQAPP